MMIMYEIHTFRDGVWRIDSIFDDKDLAVLEAQRMERNSRYGAIRVIEESFEEATDRTVTRTIYRSSNKPDKTAPGPAGGPNGGGETQPAAPPANTAAPISEEPAADQSAAAKPPQTVTGLLVMVTLTLAAILFTSLGAIYALNALIW